MTTHWWVLRRRFRRINQLLTDGYPGEFIQALDAEMRRTHSPEVRALFTISRSAGLSYLGRWNEAIDDLENIDAELIRQPEARAVYCNNLLYSLLLAGDFEKAARLVDSQTRWLVPEYRHRDLNLSLRGTMATFYYFRGLTDEARREFELLEAELRGPMQTATSLYFLARLDLAEGDTERGLERLRQVVNLAPRTFFPDEVKALSLGQERIGPPGAALAASETDRRGE